ncbi:unnamed protein product [Peniophora sp. CBMAI 1063]|nr:unnamed protein product [Peniophora sp. CBMAI 1063]
MVELSRLPSAIKSDKAPSAVHRLPIEILDAVAAQIDDRHDIISFALACRLFRDVVVPRHTKHRLVASSYSDTAYWTTILSRPDLSSATRVAHVRDAPRRGTYPTKAVELQQVAAALRTMPRLKAFAWTPPLSLRGDAERRAGADVWKAVVERGEVRHLAVIQPLNPPGQFPVYVGAIERYPLWSLGGLTSVSLVNVSFLRHQESVAQFARVLENSPGLERLHVVLYDWNFSLSTMLGNARFDHLKALTLELYAEPTRNSEALAALLERTPKLEALEWEHIPLSRPLKEGSLPMLQRLAAADAPALLSPFTTTTSASTPSIIPDTVPEPRALTALGRVELRAGLRTGHWLPPLIDGSVLQRLELGWFDGVTVLADAVQMLPGLKWLRVPSADYVFEWRGVTREAIHMGEWSHVLQRAPQLVVFHGPCLFHDPELHTSGYEDVEERAREIAEGMPNLRRVEHWSLLPNRAVLVGKDGGWREVEVGEREDWIAEEEDWLRLGEEGGADDVDALFRWRTGL